MVRPTAIVLLFLLLLLVSEKCHKGVIVGLSTKCKMTYNTAKHPSKRRIEPL